jgi:low density lipoprotein receptor-related protein 5/6
MDGTHREAIITEDIVWPNGIALDVEEQKIYWCDAKKDRIEVANVDGSNRKIVIEVRPPQKFHPFGLSILGDHIYWTDWEQSVLERAIKYTGEDRWVLVGHLDGLMSVQASMTHQKSSSSLNPVKGAECEVNNGGCSHLCLTTPLGKKMCLS